MVWILQKYILLLHSVLLAVSSVDTVPLNHQPRLSLVDWTNYYDHEPNGPGTYAFGYDVENPADDNVQYRDEERLANGTVIGSYGYLKPDNSIFIVRYVADENGYRAEIEDTGARLKHLSQSIPYTRRRSSSLPILDSALQSSRVYKDQSVHESRTRPVDRITQLLDQETSRAEFAVSDDDLKKAETVRIQELESAISAVEPIRFYVSKTN